VARPSALVGRAFTGQDDLGTLASISWASAAGIGGDWRDHREATLISLCEHTAEDGKSTAAPDISGQRRRSVTPSEHSVGVDALAFMPDRPLKGA
jgi:hypothetical protein